MERTTGIEPAQAGLEGQRLTLRHPQSAAGGSRTLNQRGKSPLLCLSSYGGVRAQPPSVSS